MFMRMVGVFLACLFVFTFGCDGGMIEPPRTASSENVSFLASGLEFQFPEARTVDIGDKLVRVEMEGLSNTARVGEPMLPFRTVRVLLPFGHRIDRVDVTTSGLTGLPGTYRVEAARPQQPLSKPVLTVKPFRRAEVYESDRVFPRRPWELLSVQRFRGYHYAVINLYPVEYRPLSGRLSYHRSMWLKVHTVPDDSPVLSVQSRRLMPRPVAEDFEILKRNLDDHRAVDSYRPAIEAARPALLGVWPGGTQYEYVIITTPALKPSFQVLADHKISRGLTAAVVTTEEIYVNYDGTRPDGGSDDQTRIRNFIIDAYQNHGTKFVLLGGDSDKTAAGGEAGVKVVPHRSFYAYAYGYTDSDIPADIYYACLDGTHDNDADGIYGETSDGPGGGDIDIVAEVYVGRAPVDSIAEADHFVNKTIGYENSGHAYLNKVLLAGELLWSGTPDTYGGTYKDEIRYGSSVGGYTTVGLETVDTLSIETLYDKNGTWSVSDIVAKLNAGVHVVNHLGHANVTYNMKFYTGTADTLTNTEHFILYSQGCYCGSFDNRGTTTSSGSGTTDSIAEHFLGQAHGGVAILMNSRYGWGDPGGTLGSSQYLDREFFDAIIGESISNLGWANQDSKEDNIGRINQDAIRWCMYEMNLMGDPETQVKISMNHRPSADAGADQTVTEGGGSVTLDGSASSDDDGDSLTYNWTQTAGPAVTLSDPQAKQPAFDIPAVDCEEVLTFSLVVNDGQFDSTPDTVNVIVHDLEGNHKPVADAGADFSVDAGDGATLDGSNSADPDGDNIAYSWVQTSGPAVTLSDPAAVNPSFTAPDTNNRVDLVFELTVNDGLVNSLPDAVTVTIVPGPATLPFYEGFESGILEAFWTATSSYTTGRIQVTTANGPRQGTYHLTMDTSDSTNTVLNELVLDVDMSAAGATGEVWLEFWHKEFGDEDNVMPDSFSGSSNSDGVALSVDGVNWYKAQGLVDADGISANYVRFRVNLSALAQANGLTFSDHTKLKFQQYDNYPITTDGFAFDDIRVFEQGPNQPPLADAGADQTINEGELVNLDGSGSVDPDNWPEAISYGWSQTGGTTVSLSGADTATPSFYAPNIWNGDEILAFELSACDGQDCGTDTVQITVSDNIPNQAPVANAGADQIVDQGLTVQLDGSGSSDPDGGPQPLDFYWLQTAGPSVSLSDPLSATPTFQAPIVTADTVLTFSLEVCDGLDCATDAVSVTVQPIPIASLPFAENFDTGSMSEFFKIGSQGRILVTSANGPRGGSGYHLTMDSPADGANALNELILRVDLANLSGSDDVWLDFWHKEFNDEDNAMPDTFTGSYSADGVALSVDGTNWYKIQGLLTADGISSAYTRFMVNLSQEAAAKGITLGAQTMIKFQQYDNYTISTDGFAFDDIRLYQQGPNQTPVADAGPDATVSEQSAVGLDGTASVDPDNWPDPIGFAWTQTAGTPVTLSGADSAAPTFTAPTIWNGDETLTFSLEVCDGQACAQDTVTITVLDNVPNQSPVANAGPDQTVEEGQLTALDASGSSDPDGGPQALEFTWSQTSGPAVSLSDPTSATPTFVAPPADATLTLIFQVEVCDGLDCGLDSVTVTVEPIPTAVLPFLENFDSGGMSEFFTASSTSPGRILVTSANSPRGGSGYHLTMDSATDGTNALNELVLRIDLSGVTGDDIWLDFWHKEFGDEDNAMPDTFAGSTNADGVAISVDGTNWHKLQGLLTADGISATYTRFMINLSDFAAAKGLTFSSATLIKFQQYDNYAISTDGFAFDDIRMYQQGPNQPPLADAGADQTVDEGVLVNLDGSGSHDPDNWPDAISYGWSQTSGLAVTLSASDTATPSFTAPSIWNGDEILSFQLSVCDGQDCAQDSVQVTITDNVPNQAPVADAGPDQTVFELSDVQLDASGSSDPDGGPQALEFAWTQLQGPPVVLSDPAAAAPIFVAPDVDARVTLEFSVEVCDGEDCASDTVLITVDPIPGAALPFAEDFNSGSMSEFFDTNSTATGRILVTSANSPRGGSGYHLTMDSSTDGTSALNELSLRVNLQNVSGDDVWLEFHHKEFGDEDNVMPDAFSGSSNTDGVAISVDGSNWRKIQGLVTADGISSAYTRFRVNLTQFAAARGIVLTSPTWIKFQQYDNYAISTDGFAFDDIRVFQQGANQPPLADAGGDRTADENTAVSLDGSGSHDPDNWPDPISYGWSQTSGQAVALSGADTAAPSFTAPHLWNGDETLTFQLTVCDGELCASDAVSVTILDNAPNQAPLANAGPDQSTEEGQIVQLDASGSSDPDGGPQPLEFTWTQISGIQVALSDPTIAAPTFEAPVVGSPQALEFSVEVCDGLDCSTDQIIVTVGPIPTATLPFVEDFETGALADYWRVADNPYADTRVDTANTPNGTYHLLMDSTTDGQYALNELTLTVDLKNHTGIELKFYHKEFGDEDNALPATFSGSYAGDGIAVSLDGTNWYKAQGLTSAEGISSAYTQFTVDLDALAAQNGLTWTARTRIRFQQYDNYGIATDGFAFDDIEITSTCTPDCEGKQCGDDGCGGSCGVCNDSNDCTDDTCNGSFQCEFSFAPAGSPCGVPDAGLCDAQDTCDGAGSCQINYQPAGITCRPAAGLCDVEETCTGSSADCPDDKVQPDTLVCRPAAGDCDVEETCDGASPQCPPDAYLPDTVVCRAAAGGCDLLENCTGVTPDCPADGYMPDSITCRAAAGACDSAENCTGGSPDCPPDQFQPDTLVCRPAAGSCDLEESCDGISPLCPQDAFQPDTAVCRPAVGGCDISENCTGAAPDCPADALKPASAVCRQSAGLCDVEEVCDGLSVDCPVDALEPDTTVCRQSTQACDPEEVCTGGSAECPADVNNCNDLPFEENFDDGQMSEYFEINSTNTGRILITDSNSPAGGDGYHLTMDSSTSYSSSLNELILTIDLAGVQLPSRVFLEFAHKEFSDEDDVMPDSFSGSHESDGVAISVDYGQTWYKVQGLTGADGISSSYQTFVVDLTSAASQNGISLESPTLIKFQQYDNYPIATDGFAFDDIKLYSFDPSQPPEADFSFAYAGFEVAFTDQSSDAYGSIVAWAWDFGDGQNSTEQNPTHTYTTAGTYTVTLTVTDNDGQTDSHNRQVSVPQTSYCDSRSDYANEEWIGRVQIGDFINASDGQNYSDFTAQTATLAAGQTYAVELTPDFSYYAYSEYFRIWIDFNQDGDFDDAGELVFANWNNSSVTGDLTVPATVPSGTTRMRVSMKYNAYPSPCETFTYGEVEDYTVDFGQ